MNTIDRDDLHPPASHVESREQPKEPGLFEVVEEQLLVGKRVVDSGRGMRLHKRVHEDVVRVDVPLAKQQVSVERVAVGRDVDGPVDTRWEGDVMVVPVVEERLVWRKQLVLVEELRITRRELPVQASQDVTLRREEITVERFGPDERVAAP